MPKEFFTERDIEDMVKRGVTSLQVDDTVVLTELAYEKAQRLGLTLITPNTKPPAAPERPYLSQQMSSPPTAAVKPSQPDLHQRIKDAVMAKLAGQVEPALLDSIISRVLENFKAG
jgi:hypothetical protein